VEAISNDCTGEDGIFVVGIVVLSFWDWIKVVIRIRVSRSLFNEFGKEGFGGRGAARKEGGSGRGGRGGISIWFRNGNKGGVVRRIVWVINRVNAMEVMASDAFVVACSDLRVHENAARSRERLEKGNDIKVAMSFPSANGVWYWVLGGVLRYIGWKVGRGIL
jgi:hypothetical protein